MGKLILGFASGIAFTCLAFFFLHAQSHDSATEEVGTSRPLPDESKETVAENRALTASNQRNAPHLEREGPNGLEESIANGTGGTRDLTADQLRNLALDELQAMLETPGSDQLALKARAELSRRENVEKWRTEPPARAITLPPEFAWLKEHPDSRHERLQREAVDPDWSTATELQIATFLAERPAITEKYGQPTVNCRTSGCEVAFVAYGLDESELAYAFDGSILPQSFFQPFSVAEEAPWADQFLNPGSTLFNARRQVDATTILWHLLKVE